ncbi:MAG: twin-arginine translocase subunit TatC [Phycisphaerae bacterium]|nr:twin-arginine translocase subunit TatC [Phycisphaerae bacterium]
MVWQTPEDNQPRMALGEHLEELRRRILYALAGLGVTMGLSLIYGKWLVWVLARPYALVAGEQGLDGRLAVLSTTAAVGVYFRVCLIAGAVLASPWIFYQLWMFVSAGLYRRERRYVVYAIPLSVALFVGGAAFFLLVVATPTLRFLIGFSGWLGVRPVVTLQEHVGFMTVMMLVFGLTFQTPMVVLVLAKMGLLTIRMLNKYRRHVIVVITIVAAVVTPPDPIEQILLAVPMYLLYELGVLLAYLFVGRPRPTEVPSLDRDR